MECIKCKTSDNCDGCERPVHHDCSDLNASELKVMALKGKRVLKYYCEDCQVGIRLVPKLIKKIDELKAEFDKVKAKMDKQPHSSFSEEEIIDEIYERQKRCKNVMIFNLPEAQGSSDMNTVKDIVKEVTNEELDIDKTIRLGSRNKNGNRAVKVIFSRVEDANKLIKSKKDILKNRKIFINADLTPRQVNNWEKLKKEVEDRKSNGEDDIVLRYVKGKPQIVKAAKK